MNHVDSDDSKPLTMRQHLVLLLSEQSFSARELASQFGMGERVVEDHLKHIIRSFHRDPDRQFVMEIPSCPNCEFRFQGRTRLTRASRCPRCKNEHLLAPRFSILAKSETRKMKKR